MNGINPRLTGPSSPRLIGSLALVAVSLSTLHAGHANAALTCTFGSLASCNGTEKNVTFSNFAATGTGYGSTDTITIIFNSPNIYSLSYNFNGGPPALLSSTGSISFTAVATGGVSFISASSNSDVINPSATFTSILSGLPGSIVTTGANAGPADFNPGVSSTNVVTSWSVDGTGVANNASLTLRTQGQPVPGPLPLLGGTTAFGFSRKLRQRIKSSI